MNVVDSPPGTTTPSSPSSCSGLRTSTTSAPSRRSIATCSRKFPWTAMTPILIPEIVVGSGGAPDGLAGARQLRAGSRNGLGRRAVVHERAAGRHALGRLLGADHRDRHAQHLRVSGGH